MTRQRWILKDADDFGAPVSVSQVVAHNVTAARELRGLTQDDLAVRLRTLTGSQWPRTAISMFESSWRETPRTGCGSSMSISSLPSRVALAGASRLVLHAAEFVPG